MLADFAEHFPVVLETFASASEVLGFDLWDLVQQGPAEKLNLTENAQPALLTSSVAIWRVLDAKGVAKPQWLAGHSLGEWSALVCAGVVSFEDAVKAVQLRGKYMQEAVPVGLGSMAAIIGLGDEQVEKCCEDAQQGQSVLPVNYNSPGQVVIAGHTEAVDRAMSLCKEAGAKRALPLAVSAPFHTPLMQPAAERLNEHLSSITFNQPEIPIVHNVNGQPAANATEIKELIIQQIYAPVQWVDCVATLADKGVTKVIECGPGKVLAGLIKRINKNLDAASTDKVEAVQVLSEQ